mmetsp:Transcript_128852/g.181771  ORF Transcript_128852/g.181771 Transcript_128852/m.181771 type:complete len:114 (+) Transcript_128852:50-391(+)
MTIQAQSNSNTGATNRGRKAQNHTNGKPSFYVVARTQAWEETKAEIERKLGCWTVLINDDELKPVFPAYEKRLATLALEEEGMWNDPCGHYIWWLDNHQEMQMHVFWTEDSGG